MTQFIVLLRGINVGGKNKVSMAELKRHLENLDYTNVTTYINSGNVIVESTKKPADIKHEIEQALVDNFTLNSALIKVLVLSQAQLRAVVSNKPKGFGDEPEIYYSDVIFLIDYDVTDAMKVFNPREGVDKIWMGDGIIYSQRLGTQRTKSRLGKIIGTKPYESMTIRSWNTVVKLLALLGKE